MKTYVSTQAEDWTKAAKGPQTFKRRGHSAPTSRTVNGLPLVHFLATMWSSSLHLHTVHLPLLLTKFKNWSLCTLAQATPFAHLPDHSSSFLFKCSLFQGACLITGLGRPPLLHLPLLTMRWSHQAVFHGSSLGAQRPEFLCRLNRQLVKWPSLRHLLPLCD